MIKYRVWCGAIRAAEVARETEGFVFIARPGDRDRRLAKRVEDGGWFDTFEEAKAFLVRQALRELTAARVGLERAKGKLGRLQGLQEKDVRSGFM